jgi:hypothetical protein
VIDAEPDADSPYSRIVFEIDRTRYTVQRAEYYDQKNQRWKVFSTENFEQVGPDTWRATQMTMQDVLEERYTTLQIRNRDTQTPLSDALFSERELKRGL